MEHFTKTIIISILLITSLPSKTLVFGVVPQQSPEKLYSTWQPFITYLSKHTNIDIVFKTEKSIQEFEKNLYNNKYDLAYSNPYHYIQAHKISHHDVLVRFDKKIRGIVVTKKIAQ